MDRICLTCGGECVLVGDDGEVSKYRCTCCDNVYYVRHGDPFPTLEGKRRPAPTAKEGRPAESALPAQPPVSRSAAEGGEQSAVRRSGGEEVYARCIDSVIEVRAVRGRTRFSGSGYALGDGYAITNAHVVAEGGRPAEKIEVYACGQTFRAVIVSLGDKFGDDLALLKLAGAPARLKAVKFADVGQLKNGQPLYVIGNSLGGGTCITSGIVSDRRRTLEGKPRLMTDCAVNRGNSGGPVFNEAGEVAGTIVAVTTAAEGMNYAIPADVVLAYIKSCGLNWPVEQ